MDKKITIPAGIALMVVLAVAGMLAIFSYTAATPVEAALSVGSIDVGTPPPGGATITFITDADIANTVDIVITFPDEFALTASLDLMGVKVNGADDGANGTVVVAADAGPPAVAGTVTIDLADTITVADEDDPATEDVNETMPIVTVVIPSGIVGPTPGVVKGDYHYGFNVTAGAVETDFDYTINVAADTLDDLDDVFDTIPNKPNKSDELVLEFTAADDIPAGSFITIVLHEDFQVPDDISESDVTIDGQVEAEPVGGDADIAVADAHPANVVVDDDSVFDPSDNDTADWLIQIEVGDMAAGDAFPGEQGIASGAEVTVTIAKAAGIKAPLEAGDYYVAYSFEEEPGRLDFEETSEVTLDRLVTLSSQDGGRGDELVATAKGISGQTADFWRDADGDGARDLDEIYLCRNVAITDNLAECTFTVTGDFDGGHGGNCDGTDDGPSSPSGCNIVNVLDGENNTAAIDFEDDVFELKKSLKLSPAEGTPGDSIIVQVQDWSVDGSVDAVTVAGADTAACGTATDLRIAGLVVRAIAAADTAGAVRIGDLYYAGTGAGLLPGPDCGESVNNGDAQVPIKIPNVTPGTKQLTVYAEGDDDDTDLVVGGSSVLATPTRVIANQRISLTGTAFSAGGYIADITLDGDRFIIPLEGVDGNRIDSGGSWTLSVNVPVTQGIAEGGSQTLIVTDNNRRTGSTVLDVAEPTVSISPEEGRIDSTVTITGENYPGLNDDGVDNIEVVVDYADGAETEDAEPDVDGRWQISIKVPNDVPIPSTNTIRVSFQATDGPVETTFRHLVPRATISLSPTTGPEGSMVNLTGTGFHRFRPLSALRVGNIPVTVTPAPSTDRNGDMSFSFQVPGIDVGTQNVVASVGTTTASVGFIVQDVTGVVGAVTSGVEIALEPLLTEGTLDRVFYFNNATKEWQWHIVDDAFAASNNLDEVVSGAPLWVLVNEDTSVTLNNRLVDFTCAGDDCWNLITFP